MKIHNLLRTVTFALAVCSTGTAFAESGTAYLQKFMNGVKTLDATFTQEVVNDRGQITATSFGSLKLSRPGKFRWEYLQPMPQLIVSDGRKLWIYDKELEQVTVRPLKSALGSSPAAILTNRSNLENNFTILEAPQKLGLSWVDLRPKSKGGDFSKVLIGLDDAGVQAMDLYDQFGQVTMIRFQESRFNTPLSGGLFNFTPPPGADVIGG